jgi:hypothetical protein
MQDDSTCILIESRMSLKEDQYQRYLGTLRKINVWIRSLKALNKLSRKASGIEALCKAIE